MLHFVLTLCPSPTTFISCMELRFSNHVMENMQRCPGRPDPAGATVQLRLICKTIYFRTSSVSYSYHLAGYRIANDRMSYIPSLSGVLAPSSQTNKTKETL